MENELRKFKIYCTKIVNKEQKAKQHEEKQVNIETPIIVPPDELEYFLEKQTKIILQAAFNKIILLKTTENSTENLEIQDKCPR